MFEIESVARAVVEAAHFSKARAEITQLRQLNA
jgi:hypothetical protein